MRTIDDKNKWKWNQLKLETIKLWEQLTLKKWRLTIWSQRQLKIKNQWRKKQLMVKNVKLSN